MGTLPVVTVCGVAVADRSRDERRWYDHCFVRLIADMYCAAGMRGFAVAAALWQSAEQRCREVEAADAAAVARLVRGVLCCRDPRNAPLLCVCPDHVCVGVVVMVEPGGCGSWRAAKSRGAQCSCLVVLLVGGILLGSCGISS